MKIFVTPRRKSKASGGECKVPPRLYLLNMNFFIKSIIGDWNGYEVMFYGIDVLIVTEIS